MLATQSIQLGIHDVVVAGGMESMSNVPKYFAKARKGSRLGHDSLVDGILKDLFDQDDLTQIQTFQLVRPGS
ncbi:hypothetical protein ACFX1R_020194 [Malus domestica]